jgi:hypothetical protein
MAITPVLLALTAGCLWFAAPAEAGMVRGASRGKAIAVHIPGDDDRSGPDLWRTVDGSTFEPVARAHDRMVLDLWIVPDGTIVLATASVPRGGPIAIERIGKSSADVFDLSGSDSDWEVLFIEGRGHLALAGGGGIWLSRDLGRSFSRAGDAPLHDPASDFYGHQVTSGRVTGAGAIEIVVPSFNTCGSSDRLEAVRRIALGPTGRRRTRALPVDDEVPALGPDFLVRVKRTADRCVVTANGHRALSLSSPEGCSFVTGASHRFLVGLIGDHVIAQRGSALRSLGRLGAVRDVAGVHPDAHGRVLLLLEDERILRHAPGRAPELLWSRP